MHTVASPQTAPPHGSIREVKCHPQNRVIDNPPAHLIDLDFLLQRESFGTLVVRSVRGVEKISNEFSLRTRRIFTSVISLCPRTLTAPYARDEDKARTSDHVTNQEHRTSAGTPLR